MQLVVKRLYGLTFSPSKEMVQHSLYALLSKLRLLFNWSQTTIRQSRALPVASPATRSGFIAALHLMARAQWPCSTLTLRLGWDCSRVDKLEGALDKCLK